MKNTWNKLNERVEKQDILLNKTIEKMTQQHYNSKLNKIGYAEYIGTIICYIGAAYIGINFLKIEGLLMQAVAAFSILLLFILPVISLKSVRTIKNEDIYAKTYLETINSFAKQKIRFQKLQKLNVFLGLLLMLLIFPVFSAIQGKDLSHIPNFWTIIFPVFIILMLGFAYWVLKSYNKIMEDTEKMLSEINT